MSVIVDTSVWSLAFRRQKVRASEADALRRLIESNQAKLIGPIRQELLSGIADHAKFIQLRNQLRAEPDYTLEESHFERAAAFHNLCRAKGIQGSNVDFLICAVSDLDKLRIFAVDRDFILYAKHLPISLYTPS